MNITFFKRHLIDIYHFTQSLMFTMFYNPCLVTFSVASFYLPYIDKNILYNNVQIHKNNSIKDTD